jgi:methyl-accepting chemotaxis protein
MTEIVESIRHVTDIMGNIANASMAQTEGIARVNGAVAEMNQATQQNAALVEQAAAAAQSLQDQAAHLEDVVSTFKTGA